ncbi:MAG: TetR/AcrR family transcriptional regulator [Fidelibacterota bacterium]
MNILKQDQRKEQILEAALKVIVRKGYDASRMDDIVMESGLSKGAIYWYYKSKKEIYLSLVNHWVLHYSATLNHIVEKTIPASEQLNSLFQYFIQQYESRPEVFNALLEFWALSSRDQDFQQKVQVVYSEFLALIETMIHHGIESGEFDLEDEQTAALSILINIEGIIWFTIFRLNGVQARQYLETVFRFIIAGLTSKSEDNHA